MKKKTKIGILVFFILLVGLYLLIFVFPQMRGLTNDTMMLEHGDSPEAEENTLYLVRDEVLFSAAFSGTLNFIQEEGTKVRKGVNILTIVPEKVSDAEESKFEEIREAAGNGMVVSEDDNATFTAILSFYADGYEQIITPGAIDSLKESDFKEIPKSVNLVRETTLKGDPIFKLTDNNLWYMIYWTENIEADQIEEMIGTSISVEIESTQITAIIDSITEDDSKYKVVLRSDMYYDSMPRYRQIDAKIIFSEYQGPIIDPSSIVYRGEDPGVFVKQRNGSFKWVPIKINEGKSTNEKKIVSVESFIDEAGETVKTVNYYDEILLNAEKKGYE